MNRHPDPSPMNTPVLLAQRAVVVAARNKARRRLTPDQVREIRSRYVPPGMGGRGRRHASNGGLTLAVLSREYGVSVPTLCQIVSGKLYGDVR